MTRILRPKTALPESASALRPARRFQQRRLPAAGAAAAAASVAAVALIRAVSGALVTIPAGFRPLQAASWTILTVLAAAASAAGCAVLNRAVRQPVTVFYRLAPAVLVVSFAAPLLIWATRPWPGTSAATVTVLLVMHVAVGLCCITLLPGFGTARRSGRR
jgi:drug/metabolite transporter (DMT)-like permease